MIDLWESMVRGIARLWLHLTYGMSIETYYERLARGPFLPEPFTLSDEGQAVVGALTRMATAGTITLAATHREIEPPVMSSEPMDYYPVMHED